MREIITTTVRRTPRRGWSLAILACVMLFACVTTARAQYENDKSDAPAPTRAPAGNAHPQSQQLSEDGRKQTNPFGEPNFDASSLATQAQKHAFAQQVDLTPLESLAVFHDGRVKVLKTLGMEMIQTITGKKKYDEPGEKGEGQKYAPLFTYLDMVIDPGYYFDKPLIGVHYLPLRREILENQFKGDASVQRQWMKLGRITPRMLDQWGPVVAQTHMGEPAYQEGLGRTDYAMRLFGEAKANLEMVAPDRRDQPWQHLATLPADHPARIAAANMGAAWRVRDAAKANAAITELARILPTIHADVYPTTKRTLEVFYNKLRAFEWGWVLYCLSLVSLLLAFGTQRRWLSLLGGVFLAGGAVMHAVGFVSRCIIAERFAIQNQFESMTGLSLFAVVVALAMMIARRQWLFGAAAAAVGFMVLVTATQTAIPGQTIGREAAILNTSVLLKYHVTIVLVSYGLIALGMVISVFYLATHYMSRQARLAASSGGGSATIGVAQAALGTSESDDTPRVGVYKTLADLDAAQMIVLQLAFWTLGVGILLGAWWADHSWGRWWAFDPKETWALITWIIYLIVIHVRRAGLKDKALTTAWLSVVGFFIMLWTYFGVNLLLPGLHAYA